jgi:cytochrome b561
MRWTVRLEARTDTGEVETTELVTVNRLVVGGTLAGLGLVLPNFTQSAPGPTLSTLHERFLIVMSLALYGVFLALPLTGWALVSTTVLPIPTLIFGLFLLPHLPLGDSEAAEELWAAVHSLLAYAAIMLVGVHVLAALRHHFILRDGVLKRMIYPARRTKA